MVLAPKELHHGHHNHVMIRRKKNEPLNVRFESRIVA
jgi:hypothetical protein